MQFMGLQKNWTQLSATHNDMCIYVYICMFVWIYSTSKTQTIPHADEAVEQELRTLLMGKQNAVAALENSATD